MGAWGRGCSGRNGRCSSGKFHSSCIGVKAKNAPIYPPELCSAVVSGMCQQLERDGHVHEAGVGIIDAQCLGTEKVLGVEPANCATATVQYKGDMSGQIVVGALDGVLAVLGSATSVKSKFGTSASALGARKRRKRHLSL